MLRASNKIIFSFIFIFIFYGKGNCGFNFDRDILKPTKRVVGGGLNILNPSSLLGGLGVPTPQGMEQAGMNVVNAADKKLNSTLNSKIKELNSILDEQKKDTFQKIGIERENFFNDLRLISEDSLASLDEVLRDNLDRANDVLENNVGSLHISLSIANEDLRVTLRNFLITIIVISSIVIAVIFLKKINYNSNRSQFFYPILAVIFVVTISFISNIYFDNGKLEKLTKSTYSNMNDAFNDGEYKKAAFFANQLSWINRENPLYEAYRKKAYILRDIFERPTSYKDPNRAWELYEKIIDSKEIFNENNINDSDLDVAASLIIWQLSHDRTGELVSATFAAEALKKNNGDPKLLQLALHYLDTYLTFPISDQEMTMSSLPIFMDTSGNEKTLMKLNELLNTRNKYIKKNKNTSNFPIINYGNFVRELYSSVIPNYVEAQIILSELSIENNADIKIKLIKQRKLLCSSIINKWDNFYSKLSSSDLDDSSIRINSLRLGYAIAARASFCLTNPDQLVPKTNKIDNMKDKILKEFIRPIVRKNSYNFIELIATDIYKVQEQNLYSFELKLQEYLKILKTYYDEKSKNNVSAVTNGSVLKISQELAISSSEAGLFTCSNKWELRGRCENDKNDFQGISFIWLIHNSLQDVLHVNKKLFSEQTKIVLNRRVIPVL